MHGATSGDADMDLHSLPCIVNVLKQVKGNALTLLLCSVLRHHCGPASCFGVVFDNTR